MNNLDDTLRELQSTLAAVPPSPAVKYSIDKDRIITALQDIKDLFAEYPEFFQYLENHLDDLDRIVGDESVIHADKIHAISAWLEKTQELIVSYRGKRADFINSDLHHRILEYRYAINNVDSLEISPPECHHRLTPTEKGQYLSSNLACLIESKKERDPDLLRSFTRVFPDSDNQLVSPIDIGLSMKDGVFLRPTLVQPGEPALELVFHEGHIHGCADPDEICEMIESQVREQIATLVGIYGQLLDPPDEIRRVEEELGLIPGTIRKHERSAQLSIQQKRVLGAGARNAALMEIGSAPENSVKAHIIQTRDVLRGHPAFMNFLLAVDMAVRLPVILTKLNDVVVEFPEYKDFVQRKLDELKFFAALQDRLPRSRSGNNDPTTDVQPNSDILLTRWHNTMVPLLERIGKRDDEEKERNYYLGLLSAIQQLRCAYYAAHPDAKEAFRCRELRQLEEIEEILILQRKLWHPGLFVVLKALRDEYAPHIDLERFERIALKDYQEETATYELLKRMSALAYQRMKQLENERRAAENRKELQLSQKLFVDSLTDVLARGEIEFKIPGIVTVKLDSEENSASLQRLFSNVQRLSYTGVIRQGGEKTRPFVYGEQIAKLVQAAEEARRTSSTINEQLRKSDAAQIGSFAVIFQFTLGRRIWIVNKDYFDKNINRSS